MDQFIPKEICRHGLVGFNRGHKYDVGIEMSLGLHRSYCAFYGHRQPLWPRVVSYVLLRYSISHIHQIYIHFITSYLRVGRQK